MVYKKKVEKLEHENIRILDIIFNRNFIGQGVLLFS